MQLDSPSQHTTASRKKAPMFSSKTLAERNNDPEPVLYPDGCRESEPIHEGDSEEHRLGTIDPRPEFQHGKLEANRYLVSLRERIAATRDAKALTIDQWEKTLGTLSTLNEDVEQSFAHRVVTLWLAVYA